jgi:hypothetical protein
VKHPHVMTNSFPHNKNMTSWASNTGNASSRSQNPLTHDGGYICVNMVKSEVSVTNQIRDYVSS